MDEVPVDRHEILAVIHGVHQLLAHAHQCGGAARCEIEATEQFEPLGFAGAMQRGRGFGRRRLLPGGDRGVNAGAIMTKRRFQRLKKCDARSDRQRRVASQNIARERDAVGTLREISRQVLAP